MKNKISTILLVIILIAGLSLLLYPTISDYWNSRHASQAVADYSEDVSNLTKEQYEKILKEAEEYNKDLADRGDIAALSAKEEERYNSMLSVNDTGIMGYIEIKSINVSLPIYHGTDDSVLQVGVGHQSWSSLPVGGESSHCVLSGHRGLPSAKLFSNLDKMVEGDKFVIHVLDEVYTYEVDQILIVEPEDLSSLGIEKGEDLCTLVTCTPYGINSHRLLVRGHRVENDTDSSAIGSDAVQIEPMIVAPAIAAPILLILLFVVLFSGKKKSKKKSGQEESEQPEDGQAEGGQAESEPEECEQEADGQAGSE